MAEETTAQKTHRTLSFRFQATLMFIVIRLIGMTWRFRFFGVENRVQASKLHPTGALAIAIWHENILPTAISHRGQPFCAMISPSRDGEFVAYIFERLGFTSARGSTSRDGLSALDSIEGAVARGAYTSLAVDGPRGPRRRCKSGIVDLARRINVPVLPLRVVAEDMWIFHKSWDHFRVPKPFSRIVVRYGDAIPVPPETSGLAFGAIKRQVTDALNGLEASVAEDLKQWKTGQ